VWAEVGAEVDDARESLGGEVEDGEAMSVEVVVALVIAEIRGHAPSAVGRNAHLVCIGDAGRQ